MGQILVRPGRPDENLARATKAIAAAAAAGAEVVVLPEALDLGWGHESVLTRSEPIPGPRSRLLASAARRHRIAVVAGLNERAGGRIYNSAVVISPAGRLLHVHRKINLLLDVAPMYSVGDRLGVVQMPFGTVGVNICADNFARSLAQAHVLGRMGGRLILSPCSWVVPPDHDNTKKPYGRQWLRDYSVVAKLYDMGIVAVSNVGPVTCGLWKGHKCIGNSLAVGPAGQVLTRGPFGERAQALLTVDVPVTPAPAAGTTWAKHLKQRGYEGV